MADKDYTSGSGDKNDLNLKAQKAFTGLFRRSESAQAAPAEKVPRTGLGEEIGANLGKLRRNMAEKMYDTKK